jgi:hypothetical protein
MAISPGWMFKDWGPFAFCILLFFICEKLMRHRYVRAAMTENKKKAEGDDVK